MELIYEAFFRSPDDEFYQQMLNISTLKNTPNSLPEKQPNFASIGVSQSFFVTALVVA
ncbi:hypothetical protein [Hymenobacter daeguensis]